MPCSTRGCLYNYIITFSVSVVVVSVKVARTNFTEKWPSFKIWRLDSNTAGNNGAGSLFETQNHSLWVV